MREVSKIRNVQDITGVAGEESFSGFMDDKAIHRPKGGRMTDWLTR